MDYIEREAVLEKIESCAMWVRSFGELYEAVQDMPPADVATVRHGRWIWHSEERGYLCSECGSGCLLNYESDWHKSDYCPHCGAKMDLEDTNHGK